MRIAHVCVTGSECTGKTTLARDLAAHFRTVWVPEYSRAYAIAKREPLDAGDVEPIARGEMEAIDARIAEARQLLVLDTDLVSTVVYARHYYGECPAWIEREAHVRRSDLYLLMKPDVPWVADPQRDRPHHREEIHALFRAEITRMGSAYVEIGGGWEERFERARLAIRPVLAVP